MRQNRKDVKSGLNIILKGTTIRKEDWRSCEKNRVQFIQLT